GPALRKKAHPPVKVERRLRGLPASGLGVVSVGDNGDELEDGRREGSHRRRRPTLRQAGSVTVVVGGPVRRPPIRGAAGRRGGRAGSRLVWTRLVRGVALRHRESVRARAGGGAGAGVSASIARALADGIAVPEGLVTPGDTRADENHYDTQSIRHGAHSGIHR